MKKRGLLVLFGVLILLYISSHVISQDIVGNLNENLKDIEDVKDTLTDEDERSVYLKQEWNKILEGTKLGDFLEKAKAIFSYLDPVWETILGFSFTFSWLFFLTLFLLIVLLDYGNDFLYFLEPFFPFKYSSYLRWGAFFAFFVFISTIRIPKFLADLILGFVSGKGAWWLQMIIIMIIALIFIAISRFSKKLSAVSKASVSRRKQLERARAEAKKVSKKEIAKNDFERKKESPAEEDARLKREAKGKAKEDLEGLGRGDF